MPMRVITAYHRPKLLFETRSSKPLSVSVATAVSGNQGGEGDVGWGVGGWLE